MNRLGTSALSNIQNAIHLQIALRSRRRTNMKSLICLCDVASISVGVGKNRNAPHAEAARCAGHATRDFAAVRDQNLVE
jgi:hypothetical protein